MSAPVALRPRREAEAIGHRGGAIFAEPFAAASQFSNSRTLRGRGVPVSRGQVQTPTRRGTFEPSTFKLWNPAASTRSCTASRARSGSRVGP